MNQKQGFWSESGRSITYLRVDRQAQNNGGGQEQAQKIG